MHGNILTFIINASKKINVTVANKCCSTMPNPIPNYTMVVCEFMLNLVYRCV